MYKQRIRKFKLLIIYEDDESHEYINRDCYNSDDSLINNSNAFRSMAEFQFTFSC